MGGLDKITSSPRSSIILGKCSRCSHFRACHSMGWPNEEKLGDEATSYRDFHPL